MKKPRQKSLRRNLLIALSLLIVFANVADALWSSFAAYNESHAALDMELVEMARRANAGEITSDRGDAFPSDKTYPQIRMWSSPREGAGSDEGFATETINNEQWHVFSVPSGQKVIHVAHKETQRIEIARASIASQLVSDITLLPLMWVAVLWIVSSTFRSLTRVGERVEGVGVHDLRPLPTDDVPVELVPFVSSTNDMIERLRRSLDAEKSFIADAAHELRTPIASLKIQVANLRQAKGAEDLNTRMSELERGIERISRLVAQMLSQAKADSVAAGRVHVIVDVRRVLLDTIAELLPLSTARDIDLGGELTQTARVQGDPVELQVVATNLIGNAVRYCPPGSTIDVVLAVNGGFVQVEVIDDGPGIPPERLPSIFDRFVRGENTDSTGSGLGLAIVKSIVKKHAGEVTIENRIDAHHGLVARVRLPLAS